MWNRLPLNWVKFSKKMATNAAMSLAASSEVAYEGQIVKRYNLLRKKGWDLPLVRRILRRRSRHRQVGQQRRR